MSSSVKNLQLSENFKLFEFTNTSRGSKYIELNRIFASKEENIKKLEILTKVLEPLRKHVIKHYGLKFLSISSGVRCPELNALTPGASNTSQHCHCEACDCLTLSSREDMVKLMKEIMNSEVKDLDLSLISQVILERRLRTDKTWSIWFHIGIITERFIETRKKSGRNSNKFPEFMISLDGKSYVPATEENLNKYKK